MHAQNDLIGKISEVHFSEDEAVSENLPLPNISRYTVLYIIIIHEHTVYHVTYRTAKNNYFGQCPAYLHQVKIVPADRPVLITSTPRAIFLPLCAASTVPHSTRVSRWVFLLFFDLSHRRSSWSNSISVGCLFRGRPEQVFSHCHGQRSSASSAFEELDPAAQYRQMSLGGFAFLVITRWSFDAIRHVRVLSGNHQTVVNEGVSEELHAEKIINFWCPLNFYVR